MISTRLRGRTAAERLAAKKLRQQQRKAKSAGGVGGGGPEAAAKGPHGAVGLPMLPMVPQFDSFGRPVVSPSRDPYAIPMKSDEDQGQVTAGFTFIPQVLLICFWRVGAFV